MCIRFGYQYEEETENDNEKMRWWLYGLIKKEHKMTPICAINYCPFCGEDLA